MTITCPDCNTQNRDTARFCTNCARPLVSSLACPACGTSNPAQAHYCLHGATPLRGVSPPGGLPTGLLQPNTILQGRYAILRRVGQGGMGAVYEAADTRIAGKRWAVKELSDAALTNPLEKQQAIAAFRQEAQMLATLNHPNLPAVSDFFSEGGKQYLVMEFVDGETLEEKLQAASGFLNEAQVLDWASQICEVLTYLHTQKPLVVFRDLKPGNVMVDRPGRVKLIDFGIARLFKPGKTGDTQAMGTPGYAAPEQYGKGQTDARSDVYSLGVTLHQLLTRYDPANTPFHLPPARNVNPAVSASTVAAIDKATQSDPLARFQTVREMQRALKAPAPQPASTAPKVVAAPVAMPAAAHVAQSIPAAAVAPPRKPASATASAMPLKRTSFWGTIWTVLIVGGVFGAASHFFPIA